MSSIETIIDAFITEHSLDTDEIKEPIINLVNKVIEGIFKHIIKEPIPESAPKTKSQKVLKADKIEDPSTVENRDDLHNCTTGVLNQFCKDNNLKVGGGNKKDLIDRVWRFLQGETSDEDKSSRGKAKANKKTAEKHECSGCNAKGQPCGVAGTEERNDMWFCWRHITDADQIIAKKSDEKPAAAAAASEEPVAEPAKKSKEPKEPKAASKKKKAAPVAAELVTDEE
jgi:hypothetical protein